MANSKKRKLSSDASIEHNDKAVTIKNIVVRLEKSNLKRGVKEVERAGYTV